MEETAVWRKLERALRQSERLIPQDAYLWQQHPRVNERCDILGRTGAGEEVPLSV